MYSHQQNHSLGRVSGAGGACNSNGLGNGGVGAAIGNGQSAIHHQLTLQKVGSQLRHHLSPAISLTSTLSSQQQKYQPQHLSAVPSELLVTASGTAVSNRAGGPVNHLRNISSTLFNRNQGHHQANIHTKTLYCGSGGPGDITNSTMVSSNNNFGCSVNRLPNHYIPELPSGSFTLGHNRLEHPRMLVIDNGENGVQRRNMVIEDFRQRFGEPPQTRNVMELSERPPMLTPPSIEESNFPPHILIGGQPFYLVPTTSAASGIGGNGNVPTTMLNDANGEHYTYPQNIMPIYEEIDANNSRLYAAGMGANSDFEYYCAQPGPESTSELRPSRDPQVINFNRGQLGDGGTSRNEQVAVHREHRDNNSQNVPVTSSSSSVNPNRPVSSSTSNSQHTNTSELSSNSSNDGNVSGVGLQQQHHPLQPSQHHVVVNPLTTALSSEDIKSGKFLLMADTSFSSDYVNSSSNSGEHHHNNHKQNSAQPFHNNQFHPSQKYPPRLADGFERSRSPQSVYSAKLAIKAAQQRSSPSSGSTSGASSGGSKGSSVYYYSDTLRRPEVVAAQQRHQIRGHTVLSNKMYENNANRTEQQMSSPRFANTNNASTSDESDSGIGAKFECSPSTVQKDNRTNNHLDFNGDFIGSDCSSSTPQHIPNIPSQSTHSPPPPMSSRSGVAAVNTKVVLDDRHSSKKSALV